MPTHPLTPYGTPSNYSTASFFARFRRPEATAFTLCHNYPNPFNPTTGISFALPQPEMITIEVFNIAGRRVRTFINGQLPAGGHTVTWRTDAEDGSDVASGVYLYKIQAGKFVQSKKMILAR